MTLTTEQLQDIYEAAVHVEATLNDPDAEFELYCKLDEIGGVEATIRKLIDMVRAANREAQPVAITDEMALAFHRALNDGGIGEADLEEIKVGLRGALCNFTAPPAPAATIPDKVSCEGFNPKDWVEARNLGQREGWNAYRAAMLDGTFIGEGTKSQPVSQGCKLNSPEIPDGCQWTFDEHDSKWDSGCGEAWMFCDGGPTENGVKFCQNCGKPVLLAAAPEGGNDPDTRR
ncbi:TPA: hypothetical protein SLN67_002611 [Serratia marcescens]|nr:hypothetical protein [Serratia marcescens]